METWDLGLKMIQPVPEMGEKPNNSLVGKTTGLRVLEVSKKPIGLTF